MARCECTACGKFFKSLSGFDSHRVGAYSFEKTRRCLTPEELSKLGFIRKENIWQNGENPRFTIRRQQP